MNAKRRPDRVIDTFMAMDHYERDRAFRHAMADGDRKRGWNTTAPFGFPDASSSTSS